MDYALFLLICILASHSHAAVNLFRAEFLRLQWHGAVCAVTEPGQLWDVRPRRGQYRARAIAFVQ